jgi:hypothetical protein
LFDRQFAAGRTQPVDGQQCSDTRPGNIGGSTIDGFLEEAIQFQAFPKLETQITGTELPRSFQAHLVQQNAGYVRIIRRRLDMRRKQLQLFRFTLFVEDRDGLQLACLR